MGGTYQGGPSEEDGEEDNGGVDGVDVVEEVVHVGEELCRESGWVGELVR